MGSLIKISAVLMLCGIGQAKDRLTHIQGNNATVYIDTHQTDINTDLEINFSGYTNNLHFTNVLLYHPGIGQKENISINSNYTGRIQRIVWSNVSFSFLLLNVNFNDSGKYTVRSTSTEEGNTSVLVASRILPAHPGERITLSFKFPKTNTSSFKIDQATLKFYRTLLLYNVTKEDCNSTDIVIAVVMEQCVLKAGAFSFTFPNASWLHKGGYFAWDEKGRLLDSIFIDVQENNQSATSSSNTGKETVTGLLISALLIALISSFLVIIAVRKVRTRRVRTTTTRNLGHRNGSRTVANSSRSGCQNLKKSLISDEFRTVPKKIISENRNNLKDNKVQTKVRMKDTNIYAKGLDFAKSSKRTACILQSDSKRLLSESAPGDDSLHEYDELKAVCLTESTSKESCLCSNALGNNVSETTVDSSIEYDYVIQHTFMTLRPPAPDPIVTMKNKKQTKAEKFLYSFKNVNIKPLSRVLPATLYAKLENKRSKETQHTGSSVDLRSLDMAKLLSPPCSFKIENALTRKTIDSPNLSKYGDRPKKSKARCISSHSFMIMPESSKLQDSKTRTLYRCWSFDYPRNECNEASGMTTGHQRSQSDDPLSWNLPNNLNVPKSRKSS